MIGHHAAEERISGGGKAFEQALELRRAAVGDHHGDHAGP
jgi:hypothetical protein